MRLQELGLELPPVAPSHFSFVAAVRSGSLLFVSGTVSEHKGKLGQEVTLEQGYTAAREVALKILAMVKDTLGDLEKVRRVVKERKAGLE